MLIKTLVLGANDGCQRRWRDITQLSPCQAPALLYHPQLMQHGAVAVEQHTLGRSPERSDFIEGCEIRRATGHAADRAESDARAERGNHFPAT